MLDSNAWYRISEASDPSKSFASTPGGSLDYAKFDSIGDLQQWQIFRTNETHCVLRQPQSPVTALGIYSDFPALDFSTNAFPNGSLEEPGILWKLQLWPGEQNLYYLQAPNQYGTPMNLQVAPGYVSASSESSSNEDSHQRFQFESVSPINDEAYSTLTIGSAITPYTASAQPSSTSLGLETPTSSVNGSQNGSGAGGLTSKTKIAIGALIGGIFVLAIVVCITFWTRGIRRRLQVANLWEPGTLPDTYKEVVQIDAPSRADEDVANESHDLVELDSRMAEVPAEIFGRPLANPVEIQSNEVNLPRERYININETR